tara:strand:- start:2045 stop:2344 length:300 start_codon:yes stop_codon:yes gene_type:complete
MKPTNEPRFTPDGNEYNPDLHKKPTENLEQLMQRFTKRLKQVDPKDKERVSYLQGCIDVVEYLATGKLPNDGNHDGMKPHKPNKSYLTFQEKVDFDPRH